MNRRPLTALVLLVGLFATPASAAPAVPTASVVTGATTRVSVATGGAQANSFSYRPAISADGRFVTFASEASNLVAGDTNQRHDVFLHDRVTGATTRVSVATGGAQANSHSGISSISADGRYIAFDSEAINLDAIGWEGIFVRDRIAGTTTRVSVATGGAQADGGSYGATISGDGRHVAFVSAASNLVPDDTNEAFDVFVHDRNTGATKRVSVATGGTQANYESNDGSAISADGRYVSFASHATNLVAGDTNGQPDVFLHDQVTGATTRVSVATGGTQADSSSSLPAISADGRHIAFASEASNLVPGDTNRVFDVFVHDRVTGGTARVDVASDGTQGNEGGSSPRLSRDGRYVIFASTSTNLVAGDTNAAPDVFVHDQVTGATTRVNVSTAGNQDNNGVGSGPAISEDGRYVALASYASNLVAGDTNDPTAIGSVLGSDVFVRDRLLVVPTTPIGDFSGGGWSDLIARQTSSGYLWLYPGNGAGFTARMRIGSGWNSMSAITRSGDFNRDGHEDVIARDSAGALWLYPGTGAGFTARIKIGSWGWNPMREITPVGDLDGDGYPDLVAVQTSTGALYLYPGRATSFGTRRLLGSGWNAMSELVGVGDFNRDGHVDLIARTTATGDLWLYPGRDGAFGPRTRIGTRWNGMRDLTGFGDFDRDGHLDLFAVQTATGRLFMYPGRGTSLQSPLQVGTGWTNYRPLL